MKPVLAPVQRVALEPTLLRQELAADRVQPYSNNEHFTSRIVASFGARPRFASWFKKNKFSFSYSKDYTPLFTDGVFNELTGQPATTTADWLCEFRAGISFYDFYAWHHSPNFRLKTYSHAATALLLFSSGTANIDGLDTKYETETTEKGALEHHRPDVTSEKSILIANPFGYERKVRWDKAQRLLKESRAISHFIDSRKKQDNPVAHALALQEAIRQPFEKPSSGQVARSMTLPWLTMPYPRRSLLRLMLPG